MVTRQRVGGGDLAAGRQRFRPAAATLLQAGGSNPSVGRWRLSRGEPPAGLRRRPCCGLSTARPAAGRTRLRAGGGDLAAGRQRLRPEAATLLQAGGSDPSVGRWRLSRGEPPAGLRRRPPLTARPEVGRRWRPGCGLAAGSWLRAGSSDPHVGRRVANRLRAGGCDPPAVRLRRRPGSGWAVDRDGWRM